MRTPLLTLSAFVCGLLFFTVGSASAQAPLRAEGTFFIKPQVGLSHYWGDNRKGLDPGFGEKDGIDPEGFPWSAGLEVGYQITTRFSLSGATNFANYPFINGNVDRDTATRWLHQLLGRWTFNAGRAPVAPFIQFGLAGADGPEDGIGIGPAGGLGLDFALSDRAFLHVEFKTALMAPDDAVDGVAEGDPGGRGPSFDFLSFFGLGLKYNFKSPFVPADVLAIECPSTLEVGQTGTFTATVNTDVATRPVTTRWQFGDGTSASGVSATKSFNNAGTYTVTFTASNNGQQDSESCVITVAARPVPPEVVSINASQTRFDVCEPVTVNFTANVRGDTPIRYEWNFGEGTTGTGEQVSHTFDEPGTYTVTLTATSDAGTATRSVTITAEPCEAGICFEITEMNSVFFGQNSSTLTAEARAALQENLEIFRECPNLCARIEGFAGPGERNPQALSEARAEAVEQFYVDGGVPASRFVTTGRGLTGAGTKKEGAGQFRRADTIPVQCVDLR